MKKFVVIQKIGTCNAHVTREFDNLKDAQAFCKLMRSSEDYDKTKYYVAILTDD